MGDALLLLLGVGMLIVGGLVWRKWKRSGDASDPTSEA